MANVIVINNNLLQRKQQYATGGTPATLSPVLSLFVSNTTPTCTDTKSTYTICGLAGYADVPLTYANWVQSVTACVYTSTYPTVTWTLTSGGQTIYGHFYWDNSTTNVLASYQWPTPYAVPVGGGTVTLTPQWVEQQC